jgi:hypothetical protein
MTAGTSKQLTVTADILHPSDFDGASIVYAYIIDDVGVIMPNAKITASSPTQYTATLFTASTLAVNTYKGNFTLKLCRDAGCAAQFPGSPVLLPYTFTVTLP